MPSVRRMRNSAHRTLVSTVEVHIGSCWRILVSHDRAGQRRMTSCPTGTQGCDQLAPGVTLLLTVYVHACMYIIPSYYIEIPRQIEGYDTLQLRLVVECVPDFYGGKTIINQCPPPPPLWTLENCTVV